MDGQRLTFEVLGLYKGVFQMVDLQTGTVWNHLDGRAVSGPLAGTRLDFLPVQIMTWSEWNRWYPDSVVLAPGTGYDQNYMEFTPGSQVGAESGFQDFRLPANAIVIGAQVGDDSRAYPQQLVDEASGVVNDDLGGQPIVVFHDSKSGAGLVFSRVIDGQTATFDRGAGSGGFSVIDSVTGTTWDANGFGISGPRAGFRLGWVTSIITEWYGWAEYHEGTGISGTPSDWSRVTSPPTSNFGP